jgi:hypothetical protein
MASPPGWLEAACPTALQINIGAKAVMNPVYIHDLHVTILSLLGLDHETLTYRYAGYDFWLTDVHGNVVKSIIA